jgi:hypothetical protein
VRNLPDDLLGNLLGNLLGDLLSNLLSNLLRNIPDDLLCNLLGDLLCNLLCDLLSHLYQAVIFLACIRSEPLSNCCHSTHQSAPPASHHSFFPHNLLFFFLYSFLLSTYTARDTDFTELNVIYSYCESERLSRFIDWVPVWTGDYHGSIPNRKKKLLQRVRTACGVHAPSCLQSRAWVSRAASVVCGLACWPLVPKFADSNSAEAVGFLRAEKSSARLPSEGK